MPKRYEEWDDYEWWEAALAARDGEVQRPPIHEGCPHVGFYSFRVKKDDGSYTPHMAAAVWREDDKMVALCHFKEGPKRRDPEKIWTWIAGNPISYEDYEHYSEHGSWPADEADESALSVDDIETFEQISEAVSKYTAQCLDYISRNKGIKDKQTGETAANMLATSRELWAKAEAMRKAEKAPVDAKAKEIQATYSQVLDQPIRASGALKTFLKPFIEEYGPLGRTSVSMHRTHRAKVEDYDAALQHYAKNPKIMELVQKLANEEAKQQKPIPGCKLFFDVRVQ